MTCMHMYINIFYVASGSYLRTSEEKAVYKQCKPLPSFLPVLVLAMGSSKGTRTEGLLFKTHPGGVRQQNETVPLTAEECLVTFSTSVCSLLRNWQISTTSLEQTGNRCLHHLPSGPPSSGPSSLSVLECGLHASPRLLECCSVAPPACLSANTSFSPRGLPCPQPPGKSSAQCLLHLDIAFLIDCSLLPASSFFNLEKSFSLRILLCAEAFYLVFFLY